MCKAVFCKIDINFLIRKILQMSTEETRHFLSPGPTVCVRGAIPGQQEGGRRGVSQAPLHAGLGWTGELSEVCCLVHSGESTQTGGGVTQGRHLHRVECSRRRLMHIPKVSPLAPGRAGIEPTQPGSNEDEPHPLHYASGVRQSFPPREVNGAIRGKLRGGPGQMVEEPPPRPHPQGRAILDMKTGWRFCCQCHFPLRSVLLCFLALVYPVLAITECYSVISFCLFSPLKHDWSPRLHFVSVCVGFWTRSGMPSAAADSDDRDVSRMRPPLPGRLAVQL